MQKEREKKPQTTDLQVSHKSYLHYSLKRTGYSRSRLVYTRVFQHRLLKQANQCLVKNVMNRFQSHQGFIEPNKHKVCSFSPFNGKNANPLYLPLNDDHFPNHHSNKQQNFQE